VHGRNIEQPEAQTCNLIGSHVLQQLVLLAMRYHSFRKSQILAVVAFTCRILYSIQQVYKNAILQGVGGNDGMGHLSTDNKQYEFEAEILLRNKLIDIDQFKAYKRRNYES